MRYNEGTMKKQSKENYTKEEIDNYANFVAFKSDKLQIRIPNWVNTILVNDLNTYTINNDETEANMTDLVSRILMSINEYREHERQIKLQLLSLADEYASKLYCVEAYEVDDDRLAELGEDEQLFLNHALSLLRDNETYYHDKETTRINIHKTYSNALIFNTINGLCSGKLTVGIYLKNMLEWYALQAGYKREQILFTKTVKEIDKALKCNKEKTYFYDVIMKNGSVVTIKPYALAYDNDGIHNYLLGIRPFYNEELGEIDYKATSLRIDNIFSNVNEIFCINSDYKASGFSDEEKKTLEKMKKNHPGYIYYSLKNDLYILRFDKIAADKYEKVYTQRPTYIDKKDNGDGTYDFTFDCSTKQINQYLIRLMTSFGPKEIENASIEIIEPEGFKNNFRDYYLKFANIIKD